uniref:Uncharacterized protein n=1 Tax=Heterorhabditis bacteriophora TaxID=37862 RepID=A0A1I7WRE0_HETBA
MRRMLSSICPAMCSDLLHPHYGPSYAHRWENSMLFLILKLKLIKLYRIQCY